MDTRTDIDAGNSPLAGFAASALPVCGPIAGASPIAGVALCFADDAADLVDEDRFLLLLVDSAGTTLQGLGPFTEEDVVAVWRDLSAKAGLTRMIVREDGAVIPVSQQVGRLILGPTRVRRRHAGLGARRPRFLARRKTGRLPPRPQIHRGEAEIIARS